MTDLSYMTGQISTGAVVGGRGQMFYVFLSIYHTIQHTGKVGAVKVLFN